MISFTLSYFYSCFSLYVLLYGFHLFSFSIGLEMAVNRTFSLIQLNGSIAGIKLVHLRLINSILVCRPLKQSLCQIIRYFFSLDSLSKTSQEQDQYELMNLMKLSFSKVNFHHIISNVKPLFLYFIVDILFSHKKLYLVGTAYI